MSTVTWSIQHKRDTAANFTANNPTLLAGQIGIETDLLTTTPKFKIGDGTTAWTALPYFYGGTLSAQNLSNVLSVGNNTNGQKIVVDIADSIDYNPATANEIAYFNAGKTLASLTTATYPSLTELSYVKGVTSSIQTQLNGKQATGNYALTTSGLNQFAATTSAQLAGVISDETGSGALVFGTSPTFTTQITVSGNIIADQSTSSIYLGNITPSATNYALSYTAANEISVNAPSTLRLRANNTTGATVTSSGFSVSASGGLTISNLSTDSKILLQRTSGNSHSIQLSTTDWYIYNDTAAGVRFGITNAGNFYVGAKAALATTATDGFLYVPSCAGVPTGVPTAITGKIPIVVDATNNKMYIYSGGAWVILN